MLGEEDEEDVDMDMGDLMEMFASVFSDMFDMNGDMPGGFTISLDMNGGNVMF